MKAGNDKIKVSAARQKTRTAGRSARSRSPRHLNGDWLKRAAAAKAGIYGNDAVEAMYPLTRVDATGETLDGKGRLHHHLPAGQLPPVNAFWSVTMYDGKTAAARCQPDRPLPDQFADAAGHEEERRRLADDLHPKDSPGKDKEANWLPAPDGTIYRVMRLYWPKEHAAVDPAAG